LSSVCPHEGCNVAWNDAKQRICVSVPRQSFCRGRSYVKALRAGAWIPFQRVEEDGVLQIHISRSSTHFRTKVLDTLENQTSSNSLGITRSASFESIAAASDARRGAQPKHGRATTAGVVAMLLCLQLVTGTALAFYYVPSTEPLILRSPTSRKS